MDGTRCFRIDVTAVQINFELQTNPHESDTYLGGPAVVLNRETNRVNPSVSREYSG